MSTGYHVKISQGKKANGCDTIAVQITHEENGKEEILSTAFCDDLVDARRLADELSGVVQRISNGPIIRIN